MIAKHQIIKALFEKPGQAIHELPIIGHSQTALSARLREMAREGIVEGFRPEGKPWKCWRLKQRQGVLL